MAKQVHYWAVVSASRVQKMRLFASPEALTAFLSLREASNEESTTGLIALGRIKAMLKSEDEEFALEFGTVTYPILTGAYGRYKQENRVV